MQERDGQRRHGGARPRDGQREPIVDTSARQKAETNQEIAVVHI
jgi:hypothetical protein